MTLYTRVYTKRTDQIISFYNGGMKIQKLLMDVKKKYKWKMKPYFKRRVSCTIELRRFLRANSETESSYKILNNLFLGIFMCRAPVCESYICTLFEKPCVCVLGKSVF